MRPLCSIRGQLQTKQLLAWKGNTPVPLGLFEYYDYSTVVFLIHEGQNQTLFFTFGDFQLRLHNPSWGCSNDVRKLIVKWGQGYPQTWTIALKQLPVLFALVTGQSCSLLLFSEVMVGEELYSISSWKSVSPASSPLSLRIFVFDSVPFPSFLQIHSVLYLSLNSISCLPFNLNLAICLFKWLWSSCFLSPAVCVPSFNLQ